MTYNFQYRDEKGFAIEVEGDDTSDPYYIGQVYGDTNTFQATSVQSAEIKFQRVVDELLDDDDDD